MPQFFQIIGKNSVIGGIRVFIRTARECKHNGIMLHFFRSIGNDITPFDQHWKIALFIKACDSNRFSSMISVLVIEPLRPFGKPSPLVGAP